MCTGLDAGRSASFLREGSIVKLRTPCAATIDRCARVAVSKRAVRRAFNELGNDPSNREVVREIAWLDESTVAAIVHRTLESGTDRRPQDFVVVFRRGRFLGPLRFATGQLSGLTADRASRRLFVSGDVVQGVFVLDARGRFVDTRTVPGVPEVRSAAASPDGDWIAAAGRDSLVIFRPGTASARAVQLPFDAQALAWLGF